MTNEPRKKRKLSDHALELIMRDVLNGLQEFSLDLQTEVATASEENEPTLSSGTLKHALRSKQE
ncbi:MAG: hypothetical protein AB2598_07445 [Candidatus Thiodiazotropha sp.]